MHVDLVCCLCADAGAEEYRVAIAMDAVTKACRFRNCGRATMGLKPVLSNYFSSANNRVQMLHQQGRFKLEHLIPQQQGDELNAQQAAQEDADEACASDLHCARTQSDDTGIIDQHGFVGAACVHCIPVKGSFMDMPVNEQFGFYCIGLEELLEKAPWLKDIYIDFACKFKKTWSRYCRGKPHLEQIMQEGLRLMVNWLHAAGHVLSCQLVNSGRYTQGAARRVGEFSEQLWRHFKVS